MGFRPATLDIMCNLYSMTTTTQAMIDLRAEFERIMNNDPPLYGVYPDYFRSPCRVMTAG